MRFACARASVSIKDANADAFMNEGRVAAGSRLAVELRGETFDVWVPDEALRGRLRSESREGATMRFFGELGQYRGRWQFVIKHESWVN